MLETFIAGILAGIVYTLSGYFKNVRTKEQEGIVVELDWYILLRNVIYGVVVGIYVVNLGVSLDFANQTLLSVGVIALIDKLVKIILGKKAYQ